MSTVIFSLVFIFWLIAAIVQAVGQSVGHNPVYHFQLLGIGFWSLHWNIWALPGQTVDTTHLGQTLFLFTAIVFYLCDKWEVLLSVNMLPWLLFGLH